MEKKEYIKIIEEYINYFSGNIPIEEYKNIGNKEEKNEGIVNEIFKELPIQIDKRSGLLKVFTVL